MTLIKNKLSKHTTKLMSNIIHNIKSQIKRGSDFLHVENKVKKPFFGNITENINLESVLQPWYDSLSVKPSDNLWSDLQTMADGMNTDGDWGEMDFMAMFAALETDEQRLTPFKSTSGDIMINDNLGVGSPLVLDANGANGNASGVINCKWNPVDNGVKYTQNSASLMMYGNTTTDTATAHPVLGSWSNPDAQCFISRTLTSPLIGTQGRVLNAGSGSTNTTKAKSGSSVPYFIVQQRTSSNANQGSINLTNGANNTTVSSGMSNFDLFACGINDDTGFFGPVGTTLDICRAVIAGSGLINKTNVAARLNAFFTSRGLSIFT